MRCLISLDKPLDVLGRGTFLQIFTQLCLSYPVVDPASRPTIISTLQKGLEGLSNSFPWVTGPVNEGASGKIIGIYKIKPYRLSDTACPQKSELPLEDAREESILAPRGTIAGFSDEAAIEHTSVFLVQATFITGVLLLTIISQHFVMDMIGQGRLMGLLSKACHGQHFTDEELLVGNIDRRTLIPLLGDTYEPGPEIEASSSRLQSST
ncbi:hypothetical protein BDW75DRAFT_237776 [Aspergillus navahoensis]